MLQPESVKEFKDLYLKEYGVDLTDEEALELGTKLVRFVKVICGDNVPKKWDSSLLDAEKEVPYHSPRRDKHEPR